MLRKEKSSVAFTLKKLIMIFEFLNMLTHDRQMFISHNLVNVYLKQNKIKEL